MVSPSSSLSLNQSLLLQRVVARAAGTYDTAPSPSYMAGGAAVAGGGSCCSCGMGAAGPAGPPGQDGQPGNDGAPG